IVQGRARNRAAANENWLEYRHRRQNSGPPDLDFDIEQFGFNSLGGVFVSNGPARRFRGEAKALPLRKRIHFDHRSVGLVRETAPDFIEIANCLENLIDRIGQGPMCMRGQTNLSEQWKNF